MKKLLSILLFLSLMAFGLSCIFGQVDSTVLIKDGETLWKTTYEGNKEYFYVHDTLIAIMEHDGDLMYNYNYKGELVYYEIKAETGVLCYNADDELLWEYKDYYLNDTILTGAGNYNDDPGIVSAYKTDNDIIHIFSDKTIDKILVYLYSGKLALAYNVNSTNYSFKSPAHFVIVKIYLDDTTVVKKI